MFVLVLSTQSAKAQVYLTKEEALKMYLGESFERKTIFLTDDQVKAIQHSAKAKVESKILTYYVGKKNTSVTAYAFLETRTVRTMPATYIVVVNPDGSIRAMEMLAFYEPEDYLPPKRWMKTFEKKTVDDDLWLKRGVFNIAGATLSAQAIAESVRRILTTYNLVIPKETQ